MSVAENPFAWVPSLQHIAAVKTIQMLWRNSSEGKKVIKNKSKEYFNIGRYESIMIQELKISVDESLVPEVIKNYLNSFLVQMIGRAFFWLDTTVYLTLKHLRQEDFAEIIVHFGDNLSWNDSGCVDDRTMLKSYVSNKETIDFILWNLLCIYCIEDDIVRLAGTIDWENCTEQFDATHHSIYWYRKIYGELPPKRMFKSSQYHLFEENCELGLYNNNDIPEKMFVHNHRYECPKISAIIYFRNILKKDEFHRLVADQYLSCISDEAAVYVLRTVSIDILLIKSIHSHNQYLMNGLLRWPWILFIDNWINGLETVVPSRFLSFFEEIAHKILSNHHASVKPPSQAVCTSILYDSFKKLWILFYRRFAQDEIVRTALGSIFSMKIDFIFCKLMFEGVESNQRRIFILALKDYVQECSEWDVDGEFSTQFAKDVLENDEERNSFWEIWNQ